MSWLAATAAAAVLAVAIVAARAPVARRLALRNALRRKGETALVVTGAMLGTAIITGSLLVGASLDASIRGGIPDGLGPVDVVVRGASPDAADAASEALTGFSSPEVDGVVEAVTLHAPVVRSNGEGDDTVEPRAQLLEVDFPAASALGDDPAATGLSGGTPEPGGAAIGQELADRLEIGVGDEVEAHLYGRTVALTVDRVLPRTGIAGWGSEGLTLFVAPGTLVEQHELAAGDGGAETPPPERLLLVSAVGAVFDSAEHTDAVTGQLETALGGLSGVEVDPIKQQWLDQAEEAGASFGELFLAIGSFAVLAGILLLVNIFVMLAEERKRELGTLRAVGLSRRGLVAAFGIEGAVYAVASAALGALAGVAVGRAIIAATAGIFASFDDGLRLVFDADPTSVVLGLVAGLVISLVTVLATSVRTSRVNIIRAVRDLPEPPAPPRRWTLVLAAVAGAGFAALSALTIAAGDPVGGIIFPALLGLAVASLAGRLLPRRAVVSAVSGLVLLWALFADRVVSFADAEIAVLVTQGVVLVFAAVALVSANQDVVGAAIRRIAGAGSPVARLGLAYPLARRFRTAMTLAMYSLVVFTLTFLAALSQVFADGVDGMAADEAGGFDLLVTTSPANPVDQADLEEVEGVAAVATLAHGVAEFRPEHSDQARRWPVSGIDETFVATGPPALEEWDTDAYPDEQAVWEALLADPTLMVTDSFFLNQDGGPQARTAQVGDTVTVRDPAGGAPAVRTVAGILRGGMAFSGAFLSTDSLADAAVPAVPNRQYVDLAAGTDADGVAATLQAQFLNAGLEAEPFHTLVEHNVEVNRQFFRLMQGYLALGLVIGIAGLGVIMVRAVRERRREIGMLRSLGLEARTVRSVFLAESGFVALEGILLGVVLGLVTAYQVVTHAGAVGEFDVGFTVPFAQLSVLVGLAAVGSILATAAPARQAARIHPAVALRMAE